MGRKKHDLWAHFTRVSGDQFKTTRAKCNHCRDTVSGTPTNMRSHLNGCSKVPQSPIPLNVSRTSSISKISITNRSAQLHESSSNLRPLDYLVSSKVTVEQKKILDELFSNAIHETATPFSFFDQQCWLKFFQAVCPSWKVPHPRLISGELLDNAYDNIMDRSINLIREANGGVLSIDGATDKMSNCKCNVILHTPLPIFIEYLPTDLNRETSENVVEKLSNAMNRLDDKTKLLKSSFSFISDSCNVMRDVRKKLVEKKFLIGLMVAVHIVSIISVK